MSTPNIIKKLLPIFTIFGMLYVFLIPPLQAPDEASHFSRLISISLGSISPVKMNTRQGHQLPEDLIVFIEKHQRMNGKASEKYKYWDWYADSHALLDDPKKTKFSVFSASGISPFGYLPQLAGLAVGHVFYIVAPERFNWQSQVYFARLGSLVFYIGLILFVVRIAPEISYTLSLILLLPMPLTIATAVSYDPTLNAAAILWIACLFYLRSGKKATKEIAWALYLTVFILAQIKMVYLPLVILFWLAKPGLSKADFLRLLKGISYSACIGLFFGMVIFKMPIAPEISAAVNAQFYFLLENPLIAFSIPFNSIFEYRLFYFISLFANFGSLDTNFPLSVIVLMFIFFIIVVTLERCTQEKFYLSKLEALLSTVIVMFILIGIFDATYIVWTSHTKGVGFQFVDGVQGRYFIPLLPYITLIFYAIPITYNYKNITNWIPTLFTFGIFFHCLTILAIIFRYWIT